MAIITVHRAHALGAVALRLHTAAIAYHYASANGVAVRLVNGDALQLTETPDAFEQLLDPAYKPSKGAQPATAPTIPGLPPAAPAKAPKRKRVGPLLPDPESDA